MKEKILVFSHIPKTAGMNLHSILRKYYGINHVSIYSTNGQLNGQTYTPYKFIKKLLKSFSHIKSIGGHGLKAWVDYKELENCFKWYTFLRNPESRVISHYQHQTLRQIHTRSFEDFLKHKPYHNWSVKMIAGEENITKAKEILHEKFCFVGLTESFNESLLIMQQKMDLPDFDPRYSARINVATSNSIAEDITENLYRYQDLIQFSNSLDIELYEYVKNILFPKQIVQYGGEEKMKADLKIFTEPYIPTVNDQINLVSNFLFRNILIKPSEKLFAEYQ
jgi:hypothetical protein